MNEDVINEFIATGGKRNRKQEALTRKRNLGLQRVSDGQAALNDEWTIIREAFIACQQRSGSLHCQECFQTYEDPSKLQLHHIERRGKGGAYTADNAVLLGTGPGTCRCHEKADGNLLLFSGGREA